MNRENQRWVMDLRGVGEQRESALSDLRRSLMLTLSAALSGRASDQSFLDDTVQEGLLRILDCLDQFEGRSHFLTWASAITIRIAMAETRRRRWNDVSLDQLMGGKQIRSIDSAMSKKSLSHDRRLLIEFLHESIANQLTERQRVALVAEMKGMPQHEIAERLGSNRNAIYKLTHDARKKLKAALEAGGYTAEDVISTIT